MNEAEPGGMFIATLFGRYERGIDKKGVLFVDLKPPEGQWLTFGSWLADQLAASFGSQDYPADVADRIKLIAAIKAQNLSPADAFEMKNAIALSRAIGASTLVLGTYGAAENGIGVTLVAFRVSESENPQSNTFMIGMVNGKIPLAEISDRLVVPLDSLRPKDGIYKAGVGGVSVPSCIKCVAPSMHVPDIDLQGLLKEKRHGGAILLRYVVTAEGRTTQITVAEPFGFGVDEQYVKALQDWEFKPAVDADNKPVPVHSHAKLSINIK